MSCVGFMTYKAIKELWADKSYFIKYVARVLRVLPRSGTTACGHVALAAGSHVWRADEGGRSAIEILIHTHSLIYQSLSLSLYISTASSSVQAVLHMLGGKLQHGLGEAARLAPARAVCAVCVTDWLLRAKVTRARHQWRAPEGKSASTWSHT